MSECLNKRKGSDMDFKIVDCSCPVCGSDQTRSKVGDERGVWMIDSLWFICDNPDCHCKLPVDNGLITIKPRFYFTRRGAYKYVYIEYTNVEDNSSHTAYKKYGKWYKTNIICY